MMKYFLFGFLLGVEVSITVVIIIWVCMANERFKVEQKEKEVKAK